MGLVLLVKLAESKLGVPEVLDWFPGVFFVSVANPFDEVLVLPVVHPVVDDSLDFVFFCVIRLEVLLERGVGVCWF